MSIDTELFTCEIRTNDIKKLLLEHSIVRALGVHWQSVNILSFNRLLPTVGIGATRFGIRRTVFAMGAGGTVESRVEFEIEVEWTRLAETRAE